MFDNLAWFDIYCTYTVVDNADTTQAAAAAHKNGQCVDTAKFITTVFNIVALL